MKSSVVGESTLAPEVEVLNISKHGFWIYLAEKEYFLAFEEFPWFKTATIEQVLKVQLLHGHHLYWPDLDVDLEVESIKFPGRYPLLYK